MRGAEDEMKKDESVKCPPIFILASHRRLLEIFDIYKYCYHTTTPRPVALSPTIHLSMNAT